MLGRAGKRALAVLEADADAFARLGYRRVEPPAEAVPGTIRLEAAGRLPLVLALAGSGRIFGGTFALEISTADPVLPRSAGLSARGRGVVHLSGFRFRSHRGDAAGERLATRLENDSRLTSALRDVHFERIRVEPDGRATIRHMGGALVWLLFPPMVRPIPLVPLQVEATARALEAFAAAGRGGSSTGGARAHRPGPTR